MKAGITIQIKVDPVVREWIIAKNNNLNIIKFKNGDILHQMIHEWLQKRHRKSRKILTPDQYINIYIPTCSSKNVYKSHHLSVSRQKMINDYLYQAFKSELYKHVINKVEEGYQQREAILDFMDFYRLPEAIINFEMLKKSWDRSDEKYFYYQNVNNKPHNMTFVTPITLDIAFILTNISAIICPAFINT
jgi:hypothetical protein